MRGLAATQATKKRLFSQAKVIHDEIVHFQDMSLALYFPQKLLRKAKLSRGFARIAQSCSKHQKVAQNRVSTLHSCSVLAPFCTPSSSSCESPQAQGSPVTLNRGQQHANGGRRVGEGEGTCTWPIYRGFYLLEVLSILQRVQENRRL